MLNPYRTLVLTHSSIPTKLKAFMNVPHGFHLISNLPETEEAHGFMVDCIFGMLGLEKNVHLS